MTFNFGIFTGRALKVLSREYERNKWFIVYVSGYLSRFSCYLNSLSTIVHWYAMFNGLLSFFELIIRQLLTLRILFRRPFQWNNFECGEIRSIAKLPWSMSPGSNLNLGKSSELGNAYEVSFSIEVEKTIVFLPYRYDSEWCQTHETRSVPNNYKIVLFHLFTQDYFDNAEITGNQLNNICHKITECSLSILNRLV